MDKKQLALDLVSMNCKCIGLAGEAESYHLWNLAEFGNQYYMIDKDDQTQSISDMSMSDIKRAFVEGSTFKHTSTRNGNIVDFWETIKFDKITGQVQHDFEDYDVETHVTTNESKQLSVRDLIDTVYTHIESANEDKGVNATEMTGPEAKAYYDFIENMSKYMEKHDADIQPYLAEHGPYDYTPNVETQYDYDYSASF